MRVSLAAVVVAFVATLFVVGCTQSTSSSVAPSAVTAATAAQAGQSVALSAGAAPIAAQAAPGASYDASGPWHVVSHDKPSRNPNGLTDPGGGVSFTQDAAGNLHGEGGDAGVTFTRRAIGRTISYQVSIANDQPTCDTRLSGTAQLDTTTNTMQVHLSGTEECQNVDGWFTFTRP